MEKRSPTASCGSGLDLIPELFTKPFVQIAVLDLGTNTFHLMICIVEGKKFKKTFKSKTVVKLAEGSLKSGMILPEPFQRGINALEGYAEVLKEYKPDKIIAYATSAIRSSSNGKKFIAQAKRKTGIRIEIISGEREAELIYTGVRECVVLGKKPSLIMDIGGGSTEFIIADENKIYWKKSFDIGAARILELFHPSDPVTVAELNSLESFLSKKLAPLKTAVEKYPVNTLVGSSGSFDTFAEMARYYFHQDDAIKKPLSDKFVMREYYRLHKIIIGSTTSERLKMKGLVKMRVDMIVVASICTNFILKEFKIKKMLLSKYALKEGALFASLLSD